MESQPCPVPCSEGVDLLDDPVIQSTARKHQKSPAQAGGAPAGQGVPRTGRGGPFRPSWGLTRAVWCPPGPRPSAPQLSDRKRRPALSPRSDGPSPEDWARPRSLAEAPAAPPSPRPAASPAPCRWHGAQSDVRPQGSGRGSPWSPHLRPRHWALCAENVTLGEAAGPSPRDPHGTPSHTGLFSPADSAPVSDPEKCDCHSQVRHPKADS